MARVLRMKVSDSMASCSVAFASWSEGCTVFGVTRLLWLQR